MTKVVKKKDYVFYSEGDKPEYLYFIKSGKVEVR